MVDIKRPQKPIPEHRISIPIGDVPWDILDELSAQLDQDPIAGNCLDEELRKVLPRNFSAGGQALPGLIDLFRHGMAIGARKSAHPGLFSHIGAPGLPTDPFAHALVAALNQNVVGFHASPLATRIENMLLEYFCRLAGMPEASGGLIVSGGSLANLSALTVALHHSLQWTAIENGISGATQAIFVACDTAHFSVDRAARTLGIGNQGICRIPADDKFCMRTDKLEETLDEISRRKDRVTACVIATAGTTATGAIDPLDDIATLCRKHGVWLHVDAAYGGGALISPALAPRLKGIEHADSIIIDLHKWCYLALAGSVLIYRDPALARKFWSSSSDYINLPDDNSNEHYTSFDLSVELSRRFRALPAYIALMHYGRKTLAANLEYNVECANYLAALVTAHSELQLLVSPQLSILCFRYVSTDSILSPEEIDRINIAIIDKLSSAGSFLLSHTNVNKQPVLRVCIRSYTTSAEHLESLLETIVKLGRNMLR
ncbi:MAG: aminotransferase class I/II-fold pyridoxal phosphate-dependent enzyme [Pseudomonadota bacterium]|nr:aminotransferase class I/II-fold pyridoxal phosphate-dependent enzyme [Pseudomonadota bacterium]